MKANRREGKRHRERGGKADIFVIGKEGTNYAGGIFEEIIAENLVNLIKSTKPQIQKP